MENRTKKITNVSRLAFSPIVWGLHFILAYIVAAITCAKYPTKLAEFQIVIYVFSGVVVLVLIREIISSYRKHRSGSDNCPLDASTPISRERFLGLAGFLISSLSLLAVIYTVYVVWFFRSCR